MPRDIVLIGPMKSGKTTIGRLLSECLSFPLYSLDELCWKYYAEIGFDLNLFQRLRSQQDFRGIDSYLKPFQAYAVERLLAAYTNCVFDLGAGHSVYDSSELFARVQRVLAPYSNVILLLPSPDPDESMRILNERGGGLISQGMDFAKYAVRHHSNYDLAKLVIYTQGKTPAATCREISTLLRI